MPLDNMSSVQPTSVTATFAVGFKFWKQDFIRRYYPDRYFHFLPLYPTKREFSSWQARLISAGNAELLVWGPDCPEPIVLVAKQHGIPVLYMEDGFLRSKRRSSSRTAPLSLTIDRQRPYFDCRGPSDLEDMLMQARFEPALLERAQRAIAIIVEKGLTKYNGSGEPRHESTSKAGGRRVLVVGQVEQDASIRYGLPGPMTNNDLVRLAAAENPGATIIYRPHPDVLSRVRPVGSDPAEVSHLCHIDALPRSLAHVLSNVDHVYTMTSLVGFEALLRGIRVTVLGAPFYAGWGLTDDRHDTGRRNRKLTLEELFVGAYILYPHYFDPHTGVRWSMEQAMQWLLDESVDDRSDLVSAQFSRSPQWKLWGPYGFLGWRHMLTPIVAPVVAHIGTASEANNYRANPIRFFREVPSRMHRLLGRLLYPLNDE
jgi:capsule polysaccharide export protein KpsC/LpsZ